jgi:4-hydroxyacetophenone monooxygenase
MSQKIAQTALEEASIPALLMCLAQITQDPQWLEDPFLPKRDISIFSDPSGGLPEELQKMVRGRMFEVLQDIESGKITLPDLPSDEQLSRMMSVFLGEHVPEEYSIMAMEEMGFKERAVAWKTPLTKAEKGLSVLVIGAGFSGICAGRQLLQMGISFEIVEKSSDLGGVWLDNSYPEAGVDTPNHFYSFSFAPNMEWSSNYSKRQEVWDYQRKVFDESGLRPHTHFNTEVVSLHWDDSLRQWQVTTRNNSGQSETRYFNVVITAVGNLNQPKVAHIPGLDSFTGQYWHSAKWRHDVPLDGKDVAVIGTGASSMQFLRTVASQAHQVNIFQRSPQWARPPQDYHGSTSPESKWLLQNVPYYYAWYRFGLMWRFGDGLLPTVRRDPHWQDPQRSMNYRNDRQRQQLTDYLLEQLDDRPDLVKKCLPDYPPYGKRILIDNGWYKSLKRPNVELITEAVDRIEGNEIITPSGERRRADVILLATGFEVGKLLGSVDVIGRSGARLKDLWAGDDPKAYLGLTVPDFPNLFIISGPNTALAHGGSVLFVTECQVRYISLMIKEMVEKNYSDIEVHKKIHDEFNERVDAEHAELVWTHPGMNNWYRNAKGRVFAPMPWRLVDYWKMTQKPMMTDYLLNNTGKP